MVYLAGAFQDWINRPTPIALAVALAVSGLILVVGCGILLAGKRWGGPGIGVVGLVGVIGVLLVVDLQTVTVRESESVSVTRPRHSERRRALARMTMAGAPVVAGIVALGARMAGRRRIRKSIPVWLKAGRMHLLLKEFGPAREEFSKVIKFSPYLAEAYWGRGMAYQGLGDLERGLADFDRAIESDPRQVHAFIQRARIRTEAGDLDGALADLGRVLELQPSDPELYLNRGICFFKKGLALEAAADFQRVLKLTNHSDYAEPAKDYLRRIDGHAVEASHHAPLTPPPQANGAAESTALPKPRTEDYIL